jgi:hypothetical protein
LRSLLRGAYAVPVFQSSGRTVKVSNLFHLCHSLSWSSLYVVPFPFVHGMTEITKEWKVSNRYYELNDEVVMTSPMRIKQQVLLLQLLLQCSYLRSCVARTNFLPNVP